MVSLLTLIARRVRSTIVRRRSPAIKLWVPGQHQAGALRPCSLTVDGRYCGITVEEIETLTGRPSGSFAVRRQRDGASGEGIPMFVSFAAACRHAEGLAGGLGA